METEIKSRILNELTQLLEDDLSPQIISYRFQKIAMLLDKENLRISKTDCKEYYIDEELAVILTMKNEALVNGHFEQASKFFIIEKELLMEKGEKENTKLKTEPSFFELQHDSFIFHCNKNLGNQRLIANLIEGFSLINQRTAIGKMLSY
ncbi:MAG: hypothetical protein ABIN94_10845 [Ferruginibacter sp.]